MWPSAMRSPYTLRTSGEYACAFSGVSTAPGAIAFTVIAWGARSSASDFVIATMPPFAVMYGTASASGCTSAAEETLTIRPPVPCSTIWRAAARQP